MTEDYRIPSLKEMFETPPARQWFEEVERLLKGAPYDKIMRTATYEEIELQPIYTLEDFRSQDLTDEIPGHPPYTRGSSSSGYHIRPWLLAQEISTTSLKELNHILQNELNNGQNAIRLKLDPATRNGLDSDQSGQEQVFFNGIPVSTMEDLDTVFKGINLQRWPLQIDAGSGGIYAAAFLLALAREQDLDFDAIRAEILTDPIADWVQTGILPVELPVLFDEMARLTGWTHRRARQMKTIGVDTTSYHNAGANAEQELAAGLAGGVTYIREMMNRGLTIDQVAPRMVWSVGLGPNFFMEIAKLRAARLLWNRVVEAFDGQSGSRGLTLHGCTSLINKTVYDPYNNLLRATTEAFSGVIGGCDSIQVAPFDELYRMPNAFSRRIARNIQLILREECHSDRVIDPAGGTWYVEALTHQIAEKAWKEFQTIEEEGGLIPALQNGSIQKSIGQVRSRRRKDVFLRKQKLVGINYYPNSEEKMPDELTEPEQDIFKHRAEYLHQFRTSGDIHKHLEPLAKLTKLLESPADELMDAIIDAAGSSATIGEINTTLRAEKHRAEKIEPLPEFRLAEPFERLRRAVHSGKRMPQVLLLSMGPVSEHKARRDFANGFFNVAGFRVTASAPLNSVEEAAETVVSVGPDVAVICSTDDRYPEIVPQLTALIRNHNSSVKIILAGYPKEHLEKFKEAGIDDFIHIRTDVYDFLKNLAQTLGVAE